MDSETSDPVGVAESVPPGPDSGAIRATARPARPWWPWAIVALAACAGLLAGGIAVHVIDRRIAARDSYRAQVLTTFTLFLAEERKLITLPVAQRDVGVFTDLADSLTQDPGINGSGTLQVVAGPVTADTPGQVVAAFTVSSAYAASSFAVWHLAPQGLSTSDEGTCVLSSTLLGSGDAVGPLDLGGGYRELPCPARWRSWDAAGSAQPAG